MHAKTLAKETIGLWMGRNAPRLSAALAFYTLLSLAPLAIMVVAIAGFAIGQTRAQEYVVSQASGLVGSQGGQAISALLQQATRPEAGALSIAIGIIILLFGASGVLAELRDSLNTLWDGTRTHTTFWLRVRQRLFSLGLVLAIGFLLLVSLVVSAAIAAIGALYAPSLPLPEPALFAINLITSLVVNTLLFALMYRFIPDRRLPGQALIVGAAVTAALFMVGQALIGLYLGKSGISSAYGAAGSLVVILLWVYYSALIFFLGAAFTHVYAKHSTEKGSNTPQA